MLTTTNIIIRLLEGAAVTCAIYLITKKSMDLKELLTFLLTISITFMVLDLFAPSVGVGARQGTGFGLGFTQVAGDGTLPRHYFSPNHDETGARKDTGFGLGFTQVAGDGTLPRHYFSQNHDKTVDDQNKSYQTDEQNINVKQPQSPILQKFSDNPFKTDPHT